MHLDVISSVPQGSVLGLLFFLVYIDEVIRVPLSVGSELVLYADDMLLYRKIDCPDDYIMLQRDINTILNWTNVRHNPNPNVCYKILVSIFAHSR